MTPLEIAQLARLAVSAATSIGLDIAELRERMAANGGTVSDEDLVEILEGSRDAVEQL